MRGQVRMISWRREGKLEKEGGGGVETKLPVRFNDRIPKREYCETSSVSNFQFNFD